MYAVTDRHVTEVEHNNKVGYRATCKCGWRTDWTDNKDEPALEADFHMIKVSTPSTIWDRLHND